MKKQCRFRTGQNTTGLASRELDQEIEILKEIYINELRIERKNETSTELSIRLWPSTCENVDEQWVSLTLMLILQSDYPETVPEINIRAPRGLSEEHVSSITKSLKELAQARIGGAMLYELIERARESLTESNLPYGECVICLDEFDISCGNVQSSAATVPAFVRTVCDHFFHRSCLRRYVRHCERIMAFETERQSAQENPHLQRSDKWQIACPVCRELLPQTDLDLGIDESSLLGMAGVWSSADSAVDGDEMEHYELPESVKEDQRRRAELFAAQKEKGGIIDLEAERNKYLLPKEGVFVVLPRKQPEELRPQRTGRYRHKQGHDGCDGSSSTLSTVDQDVYDSDRYSPSQYHDSFDAEMDDYYDSHSSANCISDGSSVMLKHLVTDPEIECLGDSFIDLLRQENTADRVDAVSGMHPSSADESVKKLAFSENGVRQSLSASKVVNSSECNMVPCLPYSQKNSAKPDVESRLAIENKCETSKMSDQMRVSYRGSRFSNQRGRRMQDRYEDQYRYSDSRRYCNNNDQRFDNRKSAPLHHEFKSCDGEKIESNKTDRIDNSNLSLGDRNRNRKEISTDSKQTFNSQDSEDRQSVQEKNYGEDKMNYDSVVSVGAVDNTQEEKARDCSSQEIKAMSGNRQMYLHANKPDHREKLDYGDRREHRDKRNYRVKREDCRDERENEYRHKREDYKDKRENCKEKREDCRDKREDYTDKREDCRDKRENYRDKRENYREKREDCKDKRNYKDFKDKEDHEDRKDHKRTDQHNQCKSENRQEACKRLTDSMAADCKLIVNDSTASLVTASKTFNMTSETETMKSEERIIQCLPDAELDKDCPRQSGSSSTRHAKENRQASDRNDIADNMVEDSRGSGNSDSGRTYNSDSKSKYRDKRTDTKPRGSQRSDSKQIGARSNQKDKKSGTKQNVTRQSDSHRSNAQSDKLMTVDTRDDEGRTETGQDKDQEVKRVAETEHFKSTLNAKPNADSQQNGMAYSNTNNNPLEKDTTACKQECGKNNDRWSMNRRDNQRSKNAIRNDVESSRFYSAEVAVRRCSLSKKLSSGSTGSDIHDEDEATCKYAGQRKNDSDHMHPGSHGLTEPSTKDSFAPSSREDMNGISNCKLKGTAFLNQNNSRSFSCTNSNQSRDSGNLRDQTIPAESGNTDRRLPGNGDWSKSKPRRRFSKEENQVTDAKHNCEYISNNVTGKESHGKPRLEGRTKSKNKPERRYSKEEHRQCDTISDKKSDLQKFESDANGGVGNKIVAVGSEQACDKIQDQQSRLKNVRPPPGFEFFSKSVPVSSP